MNDNVISCYEREATRTAVSRYVIAQGLMNSSSKYCEVSSTSGRIWSHGEVKHMHGHVHDASVLLVLSIACPSCVLIAPDLRGFGFKCLLHGIEYDLEVLALC